MNTPAPIVTLPPPTPAAVALKLALQQSAATHAAKLAAAAGVCMA